MPESQTLRSWTHDVGRRTRFFDEFEPRFVELHGFSEAELHRRYPSDGHGGHDFIPLLDGFDRLLADHPEILALDRQRAIEINNAAQAHPDRLRLALHGQYEDQVLILHEGLGATLGPLFLQAMLDGRLPRVYQLLSKYRPGGRVAWEGASCNPAKTHWAQHSRRPYLDATDEIAYVDVEGGDAHAGLDGSFPSGHTSEAYWQGMTLATLLPEFAHGILIRTAESGHSRILLGAHYPLDVIGGRMMGSYIAANRWHDAQFRPLLEAARAELMEVLEAAAGCPLAELASSGIPYPGFGGERFDHRAHLTYGFPQIGAAGAPLEIPAQAPDLLRTSHPSLTYAQRAEVLRLTALDSGYPLDKSGPFGGWQRLDLLSAMTTAVTVAPDGAVQLNR